jgi:hypothetical protein
MKIQWMIGAALALATAGSLAFVQGSEEAAPQAAPQTTAQAPNPQPIQFPHNIHAGDREDGGYAMECQYCHYSAERSWSAGIPPVSTCVGCHTFVRGQTPEQQEQISKVLEYANNDMTIPWVRIHKVADHVHFPHMRHINAGLECQECHGQIQEMGVLVEPDPAWGDGKMGWCISCHVEQQVNRDCTTCHY